MKAVIIAGGRGTRLKKLAGTIPKPMLKINEKPILEHQIDVLKRYNISEIIICTGYHSEIIEDFFSNNDFGIKIRCCRESRPLGTAGCIKQLEGELIDDFLVVYGDIIFDMNIDYLANYHFQKKPLATLVAHPNDHPYDSDIIEVDDSNKITGFLNKPHSKELVYRNLVNAGIYILSGNVFDYIVKDEMQDFAKDIFPKMIKNNESIYAYNTPEYIKDIGTVDRLHMVTKDCISGKIYRLNLSNPRPAIFLDRDGVINEEINILARVEDFKLMPKVPEAIKKINNTDCLAVVITNQPVVAKGFCSIQDICSIHKKMETLLGKCRAKIDRIYFCPHHPEKGHPGENLKYKIRCSCRKPKTGMIDKAKKDLNIDTGRSFLIGDRTVDIKTAINAGMTSIGIRTGYGCKDGKYNVGPTYWADELNNAIDVISSLKVYSDFNKEILSKINKEDKKTYIIAVGGVSRSGKTIFTINLKKYLESKNLISEIINMDHWIIPVDKRKESQNVTDRYQMKKFEEDLKKIICGNEVILNEYSPLKRAWSDNKIKYLIKDTNVIIVSGTCILNSKFIVGSANLKIYIEIADKVYKNRFYNFYKWKELNDADIDMLFEKRLEDEVLIIKKGKKYANLIIRGDYYDN